jgi:hypothetical protein
MRSEARQKSLNGIRQIVDAAKISRACSGSSRAPPTFFDDRHGVKGLEPLYDRIKFESFGGAASLRQPQFDLNPSIVTAL